MNEVVVGMLVLGNWTSNQKHKARRLNTNYKATKNARFVI